MDLIEALKKWDRVTCDELIDIMGYGRYDNTYIFFDEIHGLDIRQKVTGSSCVVTKAIFFSNSYREWKEN